MWSGGLLRLATCKIVEVRLKGARSPGGVRAKAGRLVRFDACYVFGEDGPGIEKAETSRSINPSSTSTP